MSKKRESVSSSLEVLLRCAILFRFSAIACLTRKSRENNAYERSGKVPSSKCVAACGEVENGIREGLHLKVCANGKKTMTWKERLRINLQYIFSYL
jgi:hypothetical protein